jgi:hypothetical protein
VDAWSAFLSGLKDALILENSGGLITQTVDETAAFLRHTAPTGDGDIGSSYTQPNSWRGFTALSEDQLAQLAEEIVEGIRSRTAALGSGGNPIPFGALSLFVNRMPSSADSQHRRTGLLQAAIERSGINDNFSTASLLDTSNWNTNKGDIITGNPEDITDYNNSDYQLNTASVAATHLLQSDILQMVGPYISPRSDTFRIRSFGAAIDPISGESRSNAWLEAIVQRTPDPVYPDSIDQLEPTEKSFIGRRFKIVSLRWLDQNEI